MVAFAPAGHLPPDPVADYRDNRLAQWNSGDLDSLFAAARAHASRSPGRPTSSRPNGESVDSQLGEGLVSLQTADRAASLASVGEYRRAIAALNATPIASGPSVHEELTRLHPQDEDNLVDIVPDPFTLPRLKFDSSTVDVMEVVARCPKKSSPHVDGWRFEALRALGSPQLLKGLAEAIANAEVPLGASDLLASATLIPLDKLTAEERRVHELENRAQAGTLRPIGIDSVLLVRFANRVLLASLGDSVSKWLVERHQFGVGIRGGIEIVQFLVRATLDASCDWADMQGNASNAFNEFLRRPLFEELLADATLRPLLRVATMLYGRPSTLYVYDSSTFVGPALRIPSTRGVHQGCVLGPMFFAIVASRVYTQLAAVDPDTSIVCAYSDDVHIMGPPDSLIAIGEVMPSAYATIGLKVSIHKNSLYSPLGVGSSFDNLSSGHTLHGVAVSTEGTKVLGCPIGSVDFATGVLNRAIEAFDLYGGRLVAMAAHNHSHPAMRIHQHCNRRFGHFARTTPRGLGRSEGYGDTIETFFERADDASIGVVAGILGVPVSIISPDIRCQMSLPIRFGGMGVGDLVASADPAHLGAAGLAIGSAIRFLKAQDAHLRPIGNNDTTSSSSMSAKLASGIATAISCSPATLDTEFGLGEQPMWAFELASTWRRIDESCGDRALEECAPIISAALDLLPSKRPLVARAGCVAEDPAPDGHTPHASLDDLPSLVHYSSFASGVYPKLQSDVSERVNLVRMARLAPHRSLHSRPESKRFMARLNRGALAFLASDPPTTGRSGELREKFPEHYDIAYRVATSRTFGLPSAHVLSLLRSPAACASCNLSVQAMRGAFESAGADMSTDSWATAFADHLARCGGDSSVHTTHSWLVTAVAEIFSEIRGALGVGVEVLTNPDILVQLPSGNDGFPADIGVVNYHGIRGLKLAVDGVIAGHLGEGGPPTPAAALRRAEKRKLDKYSEGVRNRPDIRFIPFAVTEFGALGGHAAALLSEMAKQVAASQGMHVGKLLASWRRRISLAVHIAHADNVMRGAASAAENVAGASDSRGVPSPATSLFTRALGRKRPRSHVG